MSLDLVGKFAPLVTPFTDDGTTISEVRLARLIRSLVEQGRAGFVCCTTAGEFTTVSTAERRFVLEVALREAKGVPVLAHCTRLGTLQTLDLVKHAGEKGARAAVIMPPYFGTLSNAELAYHFRTICSHSTIPIILVDPRRLVGDELREELGAVSNLSIAESPAQSDQFRYGNLEVRTAYGLPGTIRNVDQLDALIQRYGSVRVLKAGLLLLGVEAGPPRPPSLPLPQSAIESLATIVQEA